MNITLSDAAALLKQSDHVLILSHQSPDGDTLGCAGALCFALTALGKQARVLCADPIPQKYDYMLADLPSPAFEPELIVAVDVADEKLLGEALASYFGRVDLCLDHHGSNTQYAKRVYVDTRAAAACEIIFELIGLLGLPLTLPMARCLFTGLTTDTGCFRYASTTPRTMRIAAQLMELGVEAARINFQMFELKSRARLELERAALDAMEYYFDGQCAMTVISRKMVARAGADEGELEGLAPMMRNIEGVRLGLTLREKGENAYKVSVRTGLCDINAARLCAKLGGGGHPQAAGCFLAVPLNQAKALLLKAAEPFLTGEEQ